jgi:hypothetical protein
VCVCYTIGAQSYSANEPIRAGSPRVAEDQKDRNSMRV